MAIIDWWLMDYIHMYVYSSEMIASWYFIYSLLCIRLMLFKLPLWDKTNEYAMEIELVTYRWIAQEMQSGLTLSFLLWRFNLKSETVLDSSPQTTQGM